GFTCQLFCHALSHGVADNFARINIFDASEVQPEVYYQWRTPPFVLFLSRHLIIFYPEGCRRDIPQTRVTTLTIVENLNVFPYY
ncbi:hypothetical protein, partial [Escherichia coli]|uniref:hypothetical protein n=1 Tax=Escherichia coli TaxID=562 RepID=UPI001F31FAA5